MLRTGKTQQYGARRCLSPKAKQYAPRGCARCKTTAIAVKPISIASLRCAKLTGFTDGGPNASWSETPALDFTACRLRFPRVAMELAVMPFRSSGGDSEKLAPRYRDCARWL